MKPVVALSTCWNSHRHQDGYAMLQEIAGLGFKWVELSHGVRIILVPGILKAVEEGLIKVASCHNFCPLPTGVIHAAPNLYLPSSRDPREREQWLRHTRRTIDFARQVRAAKVVLHLGAVEFFWFNPARPVRRYRLENPQADLAHDPAYRKLLARALEKLRARMPVYWEHTRATLDELRPHADQQGVLLGCENREKFEELPLDADSAAFVSALPDTSAGYWHDTGHAAIKERLGLLNHREHLAANAARLIGFHLHDVNAEGYDHQAVDNELYEAAVGRGEWAFAMTSVVRHLHPIYPHRGRNRTPMDGTYRRGMSKGKEDMQLFKARLEQWRSAL